MAKGLHNIISSGAIQHGITAPPVRLANESDEDYAVRYDEWYWGVTAWKTEER